MHFAPFGIQIHTVFVILLFVVNNIFAKPTTNSITSVVNEFKLDDISKGAYSFGFKTPENVRNENGHLDDEGNLVVDGYYYYTDPDGNTQFVSYHADKDGYRVIDMPPPGPVEAPAPIAAPGIDPNIVASLLG